MVTTTNDANVTPSGNLLSGSIVQVVTEPEFAAEVTGIQGTFSI